MSREESRDGYPLALGADRRENWIKDKSYIRFLRGQSFPGQRVPDWGLVLSLGSSRIGSFSFSGIGGFIWDAQGLVVFPAKGLVSFLAQGLAAFSFIPFPTLGSWDM